MGADQSAADYPSILAQVEGSGSGSAAPAAAPVPAAFTPKAGGKVVVFGDSDFASNQLVDQLTNKDLLLNTIAWMVGEGDQLAVRAKGGRVANAHAHDRPVARRVVAQRAGGPGRGDARRAAHVADAKSVVGERFLPSERGGVSRGGEGRVIRRVVRSGLVLDASSERDLAGIFGQLDMGCGPPDARWRGIASARVVG
jgi:hypothetical protein